jgi:thymidylate kinase
MGARGISLREAMKIAFIGTHGIGKTTLAYELCNELKKQHLDVGFIDEIARRCPFPINEATSLEAQTWILATTMAREMELNKIYPNIICDRSVIDNYVYLYHKFGHIRELHSLATYWVRTYDLLFKVPFTRKYLRPDGVRSTDHEFQEAIDQKLEQVLREDGIPYHHHVVMSDTVQNILEYHTRQIGPLQIRIPGI